MRLAIMQPYLFPYIGYFQLLSTVDRFIIYDDVNYIKGGWINRNRLLFNGNVSYFGIQTKNASSYSKINKQEIASTNDNNIKKLKRSIQQNYKQAPHFDEVNELICEVLDKDFKFINEFALLSIKLVMKYLKINTEIVDSSTVYNNDHLSGTDRVISICKFEGTDIYVNLYGGRELYSKDYFEKNGLELKFLKPIQMDYPQFSSSFFPWLSIIDILMHNSIDQVKVMLNSYQEV